MSTPDEQNPAPEPTSGPTPDPTPPEGGAEHNPNREAAKYRRERNEIRAERDQLRTRLDERDRQDVERLLADRLQSPGDAWLDPGFTLDAMRADDGLGINMGKVEAEVAALEQRRPHWRKQTVYPDVPQGPRGGPAPEPPSFGSTIKGALRGR